MTGAVVFPSALPQLVMAPRVTTRPSDPASTAPLPGVGWVKTGRPPGGVLIVFPEIAVPVTLPPSQIPNHWLVIVLPVIVVLLTTGVIGAGMGSACRAIPSVVGAPV